jgi:peptidoglycan/LPS O-acetylase OafA/YrhL
MGITRFRVLDSCRGLCAVIVMLFHLDALTHFYRWSFIRNGWVAVDFFFVLSGFVIASAYSKRLQSTVDASRFALRRFGRLYPLHFAVLLGYVAIELGRRFLLHADDTFTENTGVSALAANLLLIQGFTPDHETWNYPAWSISIELWTNFALAIMAVACLRRFVACALLIVIGTGSIMTLGDRLAWPVSAAEFNVLSDAVRSVFGFFLGYLAFSLFDLLRNRGWSPPRTAELLTAPLVVCAFGYADTLPSIVPPLAFVAVVFLLAFEAGAISRVLQRRVCIRLGTISYSIYLTHSVYLLVMEGAVYALAARFGLPASITVGGDDLLTLGGPWAMDGAALVCVSAMLIGSLLTYRYIEEPARLFFNRLSNRIPVQNDRLMAGQIKVPAA